jgi:hypothetical protein
MDRLLRPSRSPVPSLVVLAVLACGWYMLRPGSLFREIPLETPDMQLMTAGLPLGASSTPGANDGEATLPIAMAVAPSAPLRLEMQITGPCWIAAETDGDRVVYRLMVEGESVVLEAQHEITLRVGDAGAVAFWINGTAGRSLGRDGEVADLHVTPDNIDSLREDTVNTASRERPSTPSRPAASRRATRT